MRALIQMAAMLPASNFKAMAMVSPQFRVAVMGDAHGDFLDGECAVLERVAKPDLFLAVGDFNNEDAAIIRTSRGGHKTPIWRCTSNLRKS